MTALALATLATTVSAQTERRESTPFAIRPGITAGPAVGVEGRAPRGQALVVQSARSIRAARLTSDTPSLSGFGKVKTFPAGSAMFGVHTLTGWAYCAIAETTAAWWSGDEFVCYEDADDDGRFESAMHSGAPFLGVPLFVFQLGPRQALPAPAPYTIVPMDDGPAVDYVVTASVLRGRPRGAGPAEAGDDAKIVTLRGGFRQDVNRRPTEIGGWSASAVIRDDAPVRMRLMGAEFEILGIESDDTVRFRVLAETPAQVQRIVMGMTRSTTYTPIFIPG